MEGLTDWTRANWLGLYNRPYSSRIVSPAGPKPKSTLTTPPLTFIRRACGWNPPDAGGRSELIIEQTLLTPLAMGKPQA